MRDARSGDDPVGGADDPGTEEPPVDGDPGDAADADDVPSRRTGSRSGRPDSERRREIPYTESQVIMPTVKIVAPFAFTYGLFITFHGAGSPDAAVWSNPEVSQWYLRESYAQTGVENTVMAVLAAFRGFDTFGEAVVVFAGGIAALIVLHREVFA